MKALKSLFFYPLMFLRPFVRIILALTWLGGVVMIIGAVIMYFNREGTPQIEDQYLQMGLMGLGVAFAAFVVRSLYDTVLLKLNPHDTVLILY